LIYTYENGENHLKIIKKGVWWRITLIGALFIDNL
jgi:hypothetical protein